MPTSTQEVRPVVPGEIKPGHMMAVTFYFKVNRVSYSGNLLNVSDLDTAKDFTIDGGDLVKHCHSADQFREGDEVEVSKTQAAEILLASGGRPFTVSFEKLNGDDRQLRGRLVRSEPLLGRSMVEDLDIEPKPNVSRLREVDHRTLNFIIVDGIKYIVRNRT